MSYATCLINHFIFFLL
jgi:hypothetical protein